jgi:glycine amidinotransferase
MNVFNVNEETLICEEREEPIIKMFESLGFRVIAIPFREVYSFGGSIHCCALDVRRRGGLQSYFPKLDG